MNVPVSLADESLALFEAVFHGDACSSAFDWPMFLVDWAMAVGAEGPTMQCGRLAISTVPLFCSVVMDQSPPASLAQFVALVMGELGLRERHFSLENCRGRWLLTSQPLFQREFGFRIKTSLGKAEPGEKIVDYQRHFPNPDTALDDDEFERGLLE